MPDIRLQEILTRAVVGRCDRRVVWSHASPAEGAESVLGVHVSNVSLAVDNKKGEASLRLSAVCDLWCSHGDQTRVQRLVCTHAEPAGVPVTARVIGESETQANLVRDLRCTRAEVRDGLVEVTLETNVAIEMTGLARFWIKTYDLHEGTGDQSESDDSIGESSSTSSSAMSDEYREEDGFDEMATLAGTTDSASPAGPPPLLPEERAIWEARRTPVITRFAEGQKAPRLSIIQGH